VAGLIVLGDITKFRAGPADPGLTTEIAMLLMYGVGAYVVVGSEAIAIAIGAGAAVLLQYKGELHWWERSGSTRNMDGESSSSR
jgi:uncharacterized membrane protein (DUF4010 family)